MPNSATATLTSRATGSVEFQVRRPSCGAEGSAWSPVIRTVSASGADTEIVVSATGLVPGGVGLGPPEAVAGRPGRLLRR